MIFCLFLFILFPLSVSFATVHEWGKVSMKGAIVDTACAIDIGTIDQTINMGVLPASYIREVGKGPKKEFEIKLVNCRWEKYGKNNQNNNEWSSLDITFDGPSNGNNFTLFGEARGVQLALNTELGEKIIPGKALNAVGRRPGIVIFKYQMQLVTDYNFVLPGNYQVLLKFKINYY